MNLYDLLRRNDRSIARNDCDATAQDLKRKGGMVRCVRFETSGQLVIRDAHLASALRTYPENVDWLANGPVGAQVAVALRAFGSDLPIAVVQCEGERDVPIKFRWPVPVPNQYDLVVFIEQVEFEESSKIALIVGPAFDSRARVVPMLSGVGVEVGPGATPAVLPSREVNISYVEQKHPADWARTYAKRDFSDEETALWNRYVVDSADQLGGFDDGSLDFLFSSHVIEHLVDPISVFGRWWNKLKPNGIIAGVVPDCRYTFDWRQPLQDMNYLRCQEGLSADSPTEEMFELWCRYTAPENSPEGLRARGYSIHVNFYTPSHFRALLDECIVRYGPAEMFLHAVPNGKDFAFMIRKISG